ncbi:hypothetical protein CHS0354_033498 [Potamilus streckersoni]|uniref:Pre-mRNA-splicing factor 38 n=1 Tax=Potamilus streckersoni TaxID=2493646 RepID=A0AAE0SB69_9BIVA|nr:hypothetical protein CHS0354_033498 [Potamilus streckersoni]
MAPNNPLSCWGNDKTMNLNTLILTNIQSSPYFKVNLYELKTYHEVIDEIYYKVNHLEPWEKGSRKTAGQTGMCGGVRGVGAGGIVSSAFCLLYKLYTLKLTRKQVIGLLEHNDSPYIRALGFMYIRYTQDPRDLWDWYEPYLEDDEEIDVKAGGGHVMIIGEMIRQWMTKLEWYSTLFPRIPVPVQKDIDLKLRTLKPAAVVMKAPEPCDRREPKHIPDEDLNFGEAERHAHGKIKSPVDSQSRPRPRSPPMPRRVTPPRRSRSPRRRSRSPVRRPSPPQRSPYRRSPHRSRSPRRSSPKHRSPYRGSASNRQMSDTDFARELEREKERQRREKEGREKDRKKSKSKDRNRSIERFKERSHSDKHRSGKHRSRSQSRERKKHKERRRSRSRDRNGYPS